MSAEQERVGPAKNKVFGLINTGVGLLLVALAIPLVMAKVSPNGWYGFRTAKTLANAEIWYSANKQAGYGLILGGLVAIISGAILVSKREQLSRNKSGAIQMAGLFGGLLIVVVYAFITYQRL